MRTIAILGAAISLAALSACSGGGTASPPPFNTGVAQTPAPTTAPIAPTARVVQTSGAVNTTAVRSRFRSPLDVSSPTPAPVVLTAPEPSGRFASAFDSTGSASVIVAPSPSASPSAAWSIPSNAPVALSTVPPQANGAPQVGLTAEQSTTFTSTLSVTLTGSVTTSVSAPLVQQPRWIVGCATDAQSAIGSNSSDYRGGIAFAGGVSGVDVPAADRQHSDLAVVGADCAGSFKDNTVTERTVIAPQGMDLLCDRHDVFDVRLSDFTGSTKSIPARLFNAGCVAIVRSSAGTTWALFIFLQQPGEMGTNNMTDFTGPAAQITS